MNIPPKLHAILAKDQKTDGAVKSSISNFETLLKDNKLFFFEEYTDHGIAHVENVLRAVELLIDDESFKHITHKEVAILILAIVMHDIGMHTEFSIFTSMLNGCYDDIRAEVLDRKTWKELWADYLAESKHWSSKKMEEIFGTSDERPGNPEFSNKDRLTGTDKKLIGEFLRRNHARLAHEIALKGLINNDGSSLEILEFDKREKQLIGIIARSHGTSIRSTFDYLKIIAPGDAWKYPDGLNVVFLMVLLRIADYIQIDRTRTNEALLKIKTLNSPLSLREHRSHLSIRHIHWGDINDPELIYIECDSPGNARMYVKIQDLAEDIQRELDLSWAILGEVYGFQPDNKPHIKYRRISSNLESLPKDYVPQKISFKVDNELSKLLVAPLYGDNPTYGVRELVQNATDACKERQHIERCDAAYAPLVTVSINVVENDKRVFTIKDNGKGMTLDEILHYFLSVGASFRKSSEWKQKFTSENGESHVQRNGKFGIGILAAFLLGDEISVKTKSCNAGASAYEFSANMDSDFIDIQTVQGCDVGTEITIVMPESRWLKFSLHSSINKINWTDWYIGKCPEVQYLLDDEIQVPKSFFKQNKKREISPADYDSVQWDYSNDLRGRNSMFVACNDIIIMLDNNSDFFTNDSKVITTRPHILIEDSKGNLPLSLNRNRLDRYSLPFEDDLFEDVARDFIAQILSLKVSATTIERHRLFPHNANFLYSKDGYSLDVDYFLLRIKDKIMLRILTRDYLRIKNLDSICGQYPDLIVFPAFDELSRLRGQGEKVAPNTSAHILLKTQRYHDYFQEERRVQKWLINRHKIQWENEDFVSYTMNGFHSGLGFYKEREFAETMKLLDDNVQSIQEIPISYIQPQKSGRILNRLMERYIGDNVIIPYNVESRKKLYPLAFEELYNYMKDYESSLQ